MKTSENSNLTQWEKRVLLFKNIYSQLIREEPIDAAKEKFTKSFLKIDAQFIAVFEYFLDHQKEIAQVISNNIPSDWAFDRLNLVDQAILFEAYSEYKVLHTDKAVVIDQAIISSKKYSDFKSPEFINAILDKIL